MAGAKNIGNAALSKIAKGTPVPVKKAAKKTGAADGSTIKGLKEATAVLKDLAAVAKTLNDQGTQTEGTGCGVVILPPVEEET